MHSSILTVKLFLEHHGGLALLEDPNLDTATMPVLHIVCGCVCSKNYLNVSRRLICLCCLQLDPTRSIAEQAAARKAANEALRAKHVSETLKAEDIERVIHSISDSFSYQVFAHKCVVHALKFGLLVLLLFLLLLLLLLLLSAGPRRLSPVARHSLLNNHQHNQCRHSSCELTHASV